MRARTIKIELLAGLAGAALIACFNQLPGAGDTEAIGNPCGLTRALRIIQMIDDVKNHSEQLPARARHAGAMIFWVDTVKRGSFDVGQIGSRTIRVKSFR